MVKCKKKYKPRPLPTKASSPKSKQILPKTTLIKPILKETPKPRTLNLIIHKNKKKITKVSTQITVKKEARVDMRRKKVIKRQSLMHFVNNQTQSSKIFFRSNNNSSNNEKKISLDKITRILQNLDKANYPTELQHLLTSHPNSKFPEILNFITTIPPPNSDTSYSDNLTQMKNLSLIQEGQLEDQIHRRSAFYSQISQQDQLEILRRHRVILQGNMKFYLENQVKESEENEWGNRNSNNESNDIEDENNNNNSSTPQLQQLNQEICSLDEDCNKFLNFYSNNNDNLQSIFQEDAHPFPYSLQPQYFNFNSENYHDHQNDYNDDNAFQQYL